MNKLLSKYGIVGVLGVLVLLIFLSKRGGAGGASPAYADVTSGIDTQYEALKFNAQTAQAAIAGQAYTDLLDYETALAKLSTDERLAVIEGDYAVRIDRTRVDAAARIAQLQTTAQNYRVGQDAITERYVAHEQRSADRLRSWLGFTGDLGGNLLSLL